MQKQKVSILDPFSKQQIPKQQISKIKGGTESTEIIIEDEIFG